MGPHRGLAGSLTIVICRAPATVFAIAIDGRPIGESDRMLVSHLTDVQDAGTAYCNKARTLWLRMGSLPHLMRRGNADVSLAVGPGNWSVYALATDGSRRFEVPYSMKGDAVSFTVDIAVEPNENWWGTAPAKRAFYRHFDRSGRRTRCGKARKKVVLV